MNWIKLEKMIAQNVDIAIKQLEAVLGTVMNVERESEER
jgi:hypothetical protein